MGWYSSNHYKSNWWNANWWGGAQPVPSGSVGGFWLDFERELEAWKRKRRERLLLEERTEKIKDKLEREIALELRKKEQEEERLNELKRLLRLVEIHERAIEELPERAIKSARLAVSGRYNEMVRFERELYRLREEEEFIMMAFILLSD